MAPQIRAALRGLHRLLALGLGIWLLSAWLLAGSALLWQQDLTRPHLPSSSKALDTQGLARLLEAAQSRHPEPGRWQLLLPKRGSATVQAVFVADDLVAEPEPIALWLNAETAEIIREAPVQAPLWKALYRFHCCGLSFSDSVPVIGETRRISFALGLALACLLLSGMLLIKRGGRHRRAPALLSCHKLLGLFILPPLMLSLASGLLLSLSVGWLGAPPSPVPQAKLALSSSAFEPVVRAVTARFAGHELRKIEVPQTTDGPWTIAVRRPGKLDVEPAWLHLVLYPDGRLEEQVPSLRQWVYALHTGAGSALRWLLTVGGVGFTLQAVCGFALWRQRARFKKARAFGAHADKQQMA